MAVCWSWQQQVDQELEGGWRRHTHVVLRVAYSTRTLVAYGREIRGLAAIGSAGAAKGTEWLAVLMVDG